MLGNGLRELDRCLNLLVGETARGRGAVSDLGDAIIDAPDRLAIAERELLASLDKEARRIVAHAAKQVSLVTAVSPRAIVDVAFVLYACPASSASCACRGTCSRTSR